MPPPLLADFAIRLAGGLAAVLALLPSRAIPPAFFRTHATVILGLGVLAALASAGSGRLAVWLPVAIAAAAFAASVCYGLGLDRLGLPLAVLIAIVAVGLLGVSAQGAETGDRLIYAASATASAFLLGACLSAMLLGHHYLTAPTMSIVPLRRLVAFMVAGLVVRAGLAALTVATRPWGSIPAVGPTFLAIRWGMGIVGFGLATFLTWKTVEIRSTQSATGILYIALTLLLFGELSSMILSRDSHLLI